MPIEPSETPGVARAKVRLKDIAAKLKIHTSTVSRALRDSPSIAPETKLQVRQLAQLLDYRPDPNLAAFNACRPHRSSKQSMLSIAFVVEANATSRPLRKFTQGLRSQCEASHIAVECFNTEVADLSYPRLDKILQSRNTNGVLLWLERASPAQAELSWNRFCALKVESLHTLPFIEAICPNHRGAARLAVARLVEAGRRRIGLAIDLQTRARLDEYHHVGYILEMESQGLGGTLPLCSWDREEEHRATLSRVARWAREQQLDALISPHNALLAEVGRLYPHVAIASLDRHDESCMLGVDAHYGSLGRIAALQLASMMNSRQRGPASSPSTKLCPVLWSECIAAQD